VKGLKCLTNLQSSESESSGIDTEFFSVRLKSPDKSRIFVRIFNKIFFDMILLSVFSSFFLFAPPPSEGGAEPHPLVQLIPFVLIILVFYFFMIRPQQKKQKEREKILDALKKGDKVVTIGGLHGTIVEINNEKKTVVIDAGGAKLKFDRSAISTVEKADTGEKLEA
jgi:preprotein translocase subunit YajC